MNTRFSIHLLVLAAILWPLTIPAQSTWKRSGFSGGGLFPTIAVDPNDSDVLYLGSDVAGLYRSSDRAATWQPASTGLESLQVASLAVDPSDSARLWLGTPVGLHLSADGGQSWTLVAPTIRCFKHVTMRGIAVSEDGQTILVAGHELVGDTSGSGALYRSIDGGDTWEAVATATGAEIPAVVFDPHDPDVAFLLVSSEGVMRSTDQGATWTGFTTGLPSGRTWRQLDVGRISVVATAQQTVVGARAAVYRSSKTTASFVLVGPRSDEDPPSGLEVGDPVRIDPNSVDDQRMYLGQDGWPFNFFATSDGGSEWFGTALTSSYHFDMDNAPHWLWMDPYAGAQNIAIDPLDSNQVYYTTWLGLWASLDGGASFDERVVGAQNTCQTDVLATANAILTTNMDGGVYRSTDGGRTWISTFPGAAVAPDFWLHAWDLEQAANGDLYFSAGTTSGPMVYKSTNDGTSWTATAAGLPSSGDPTRDLFTEISLAADPNNGRSVLAGVDRYGLYRTTDSGATWQLVVDREGANGANEPVVKCVEVDPRNSQRIFMGEHWNGLWISEDGGHTWSRTIAEGLESDSVQEILALSDGRVFAAYADGVYLSSDNGHSFSRAFPSVPGLGEAEVEYVTSIAVNPSNSEDIAASTAKIWPVWHNRGSVWRSIDGGSTWSEVTGDLPVRRVRSLIYKDTRLWAATWCSNLFTTELSGEGPRRARGRIGTSH